MQATIWTTLAPAASEVLSGQTTIGEAAALLLERPSVLVPSMGVARFVALHARRLGIPCETVYHGEGQPADVRRLI
jgi:hypothetical protein